MSKPKPTTILNCMEASPNFRVELAPVFVAEIAVARAVGADAFAAWHVHTMGNRHYGLTKTKAHARYGLRIAKGLTADDLLGLVAEGQREAARQMIAEHVALAEGYVRQCAEREAEQEARIARMRDAEAERTRALAS